MTHSTIKPTPFHSPPTNLERAALCPCALPNESPLDMKPTVILDAGHGIETKGKRSPVWADGAQLMEYAFNRDIVSRIAKGLAEANHPYCLLVPEDTDIPLSERCARANNIWNATQQNAYLISIHANAGGGRGWECFTSVGETQSDAIATLFCAQAQKAFIGKRMRFEHCDGDPDKESPFYLLRHTHCPAVLTENFFMDTESDCRYIMSQEGRDTIARMHLEAIQQIDSI